MSAIACGERVLGLPGDIRVDKDLPFNQIPTGGKAAVRRSVARHVRAVTGPGAPGPAPGRRPPDRYRGRDDDDPWVAPSEAKESGFMESSQAPESESPELAPTPASGSAPALPPLAIGSWVNLLVAGRWERTQLSWVGSQGTFFLFTNASGRTQSMTLRLLDRCIQQGSLQVLSQQPGADSSTAWLVWPCRKRREPSRRQPKPNRQSPWVF